MMNRKSLSNQNVPVDMTGLVLALVRKCWVAILCAVVCAAIAFLCAKYAMVPQYSSSVLFYVNNVSVLAEGEERSLAMDDLRVSKHMVDIYTIILYARQTLEDVIAYTGIEMDAGELEARIHVESVEETEVFRVTVTWTDPQETEQIANAIGSVLPGRIDGIVDDTTARIVDYAILPSDSVAPDVKNYTFMGILLGFAIGAGAIVLHFLYDSRIKSVQTLRSFGEIPVLAEVPDLHTKW